MIQEEAKKFGDALDGKAADPISHEEASHREACRRDIPKTIRKSAEQLNAEHAAKEAAAAHVVQQMFDDVPWDLLRNHIKERGFVLIPVETDAERTRANFAMEERVRNYRYATRIHLEKARSLADALQIMFDTFDPECDTTDAMSALVSTMAGKIRAALIEEL